MSENAQTATRDHLIVGGTGMLMPLCQSLPPQNLMVAARFVSNKIAVSALDKRVKKVSLDYDNEQSQADFLQQLSQWQGLKYCVLWVHSHAHDFSCRILETLSTFDAPPKVIHVLGSQADDKKLTHCAQKYDINFTSVKLGRVATSNGWRWLTHKEISEKVSDIAK